MPNQRSRNPNAADTETGPLLGSGATFDDNFDDKFDKEEQSKNKRIDPRIIRDAIIGLSDGLTVPFALTAGLSALGDTNVVIYGGLAELVAGGISMGLGGYLGAKSEADAYHSALAQTREMVAEDKPKAIEVARSTFSRYSFAEQTLDRMTEDLQQHPSQLVDFLMCFHHNLAEDDFASIRAYYSGLTISLGYFFGGLVPLVPYMLINDMYQALIASVVVMGIALFTFGWFKTSLVGDENIGSCFRNALQMVVLGGVAAGAAMGCMKAVG